MNRSVDRQAASQNENEVNNLQQNKEVTVDRQRRTIIRKLAVSSAALTCCSIIPAKWTTPLLEFGTLPAHATTSAPTVQEIVKQIEDQIAAAQQPAPTETVATTAASSPYTKTKRIDQSGKIYIDGILRNKFISKKLGPQYGKSIKIKFSTGEVLNVPDTKEDVNFDGMGYRPGGNYTYHKDVTYMEVYARPGSRAKYITIHY